MDKTLSLTHQANLTVVADNKIDHLEEIHLHNTEIVKINNKALPYLCDRVAINKQDFKQSKDENPQSHPKKPLSHDKIIKLDTLHPPIIVNLREDAKPGHSDTRLALTESELLYLHKNKLPAILFIHGFNLPLGEYSSQIVGINQSNRNFSDPQANLDASNHFSKLSQSLSTTAKSQKMLEEQFNHSQAFNFKLKDEEINGLGAHNWFIHMENNINCAAGRIKDKDYSRYCRIINIAWPGDVPAIYYMNAEEIADKSGKLLAKLILQLHEDKIDIYIIAHSLGNRVLLKLMESLTENSHEAILKQVFMWQAAVPCYALSNNLKLDHSIKYNDHFPNAHLSAQKITVLYSHNDWVLRYQYWLANRIGLTPKELWESQDPCELLYRFMDANPLELLSSIKLVDSDLKSLLKTSNHKKEFDIFLRLLKECYRFTQTAQALGYQGVNLKDPFMQKLMNDKKLILVDQPFLQGHSAMKIPDSNIMNLVYKRWIINHKHGISL